MTNDLKAGNGVSFFVSLHIVLQLFVSLPIYCCFSTYVISASYFELWCHYNSIHEWAQTVDNVQYEIGDGSITLWTYHVLWSLEHGE